MGWGRTDDLDLDVHLYQFFGEGVYLYETGVNGAVEATEFGDEANVSLADWFVRVRAADATWDSSQTSDERSEIVD